MKQKFTSECTSINKRVPALFHKVPWHDYEGSTLLDYGCGKYPEYAADFCHGRGIEYSCYDPYNKPVGGLPHMSGKYDFIACSNVLNVIWEYEIRATIIRDIYDHLVEGGIAFFTVYEGDKTGIPKFNLKKGSCQLNRKLSEYVREIQNLVGINIAYATYNGVIQFIKPTIA